MSTTALEDIVVVAGLPWSGTAMMMKMLSAGGIPPAAVGGQTAGESAGRDPFDFDTVEPPRFGPAPLEEFGGLAVRLSCSQLFALPPAHRYRVIYVRRRLESLLDAYRRSLWRQGREVDPGDEAALHRRLQREQARVEKWLAEQPNVEVLYVDYNRMVRDPKSVVEPIGPFLDDQVDLEAMASAVDPDLYRRRV